MKIGLSSIFVDDQEKALLFYTKILGFQKKRDMEFGDYRWLTVISPEGPVGVELVLEPNANPAASVYQKSIYDQNIPANAFEVENLLKEVENLKDMGVVFKMEPTDMGQVSIALFDDTCGNIIQIYQVNE